MNAPSRGCTERTLRPRTGLPGSELPSAPTAPCRVLAVVLNYGSTRLFRCYFSPGAVGLAVLGPGRVLAEECAFGPLHAAVRVARPGDDLVGETELSLTHCSALVPAGEGDRQLDLFRAGS